MRFLRGLRHLHQNRRQKANRKRKRKKRKKMSHSKRSPRAQRKETIGILIRMIETGGVEVRGIEVEVENHKTLQDVTEIGTAVGETGTVTEDENLLAGGEVVRGRGRRSPKGRRWRGTM